MFNSQTNERSVFPQLNERDKITCSAIGTVSLVNDSDLMFILMGNFDFKFGESTIATDGTGDAMKIDVNSHETEHSSNYDRRPTVISFFFTKQYAKQITENISHCNCATRMQYILSVFVRIVTIFFYA